jgi:hypothetical protein
MQSSATMLLGGRWQRVRENDLDQRDRELLILGCALRRKNVCPPNVLAFSCEAARVISQCSQDMARLRLLQRRVREQQTRARGAAATTEA